MPHVLVKDIEDADELIEERRRKGINRHDEVWDGVYVMPSMPNLDHQRLVHDLGSIFDEAVKRRGSGKSIRATTSAIAPWIGRRTSAFPIW